MIDAMFIQAMRDALARHATGDECLRMIREYKDKGLSQRAAYEALVSLRSAEDEEHDDRVLELLDVVVSYCHPSSRIWSESISD
jgi:hypothetical protein